MKTLGDIVENAAVQFEAVGLSYGHGTGNAFDEAAFIVLETLKLPVDSLDEFWSRLLGESEKKRVFEVVRARIDTRKPAPYLLNKAYIQGIPFYVDERVIVPRSFIAEILCREGGFSRIADYEAVQAVADICTGSGCLAIVAAHLFPAAQIDAVELSPDAFDVARRNVQECAFKNRIGLFKGDLFSPLQGRQYDLIITNPPYVDRAGMQQLPTEYRHEPAMALAGGDDGMEIVRRILKESVDYLRPGGGLLCEIGRGREILEREYRLPFLWLDTEESEGEVFWLTREQLMSG